MNIKHWEERYSKNPGYRNKWPYSEVVAFLTKAKTCLPERPQLLEVGCGSGCNLWAANKLGYTCHGIDGSETIIKHAKEWLIEKNVSADLLVGDFSKLPYADSSMDVVVDRSSLLLVGILGIELAIQEIHRVLAPGGQFFFNPAGEINSNVPNFSGIIDYTAPKKAKNFADIKCVYVDKKGIKNLLSDFEIIEIELITHLISEPPNENENDEQIYSEYKVIAKKFEI